MKFDSDCKQNEKMLEGKFTGHQLLSQKFFKHTVAKLINELIVTPKSKMIHMHGLVYIQETLKASLFNGPPYPL